MFKSVLALLLQVTVVIAFSQGASAQGSAITVKIGYFSLPSVKANFSEAAQAELLKTQAEAQLRREAEQANREIQKLRDDKKSEADVKIALEKAQLRIQAKEEALAQLVQSQTIRANSAIARAVTDVASRKGIDIVVDSQSVYTGAERFRDSGVDLTKEVIESLTKDNTVKTAPESKSSKSKKAGEKSQAEAASE